MKRTLVILLCLSLNGCIFLGVRAFKAITKHDEVEQISGNADTVVLKAAIDLNPDPKANEYCAQYGKTAVQSLADLASVKKSAVYFYDCR
jgi:hypothetical protein